MPYLQVGLGFQYNDAYEDPNEAAGSHIELVGHIHAGMHLFLHKHFSFDVEGGYTHLSNVGMSDDDHGINAFGVTLGFSCFYGGGKK